VSRLLYRPVLAEWCPKSGSPGAHAVLG
jgi:hypothetical protein